jgi:hypothetical protein
MVAFIWHREAPSAGDCALINKFATKLRSADRARAKQERASRRLIVAEVLRRRRRDLMIQITGHPYERFRSGLGKTAVEDHRSALLRSCEAESAG